MMEQNVYGFNELKSYIRRFRTDSLDSNLNGNGISLLHWFGHSDDILLRIDGTTKILWATIIGNNNEHRIKIQPIYLLDGVSEDIIKGYLNAPKDSEYQYLIDHAKFIAGYDIITDQPISSWEEYSSQLDPQ